EQAEERPQPPAGAAEAREDEGVDERDHPAVGEVEDRADEVRPAAVGGEDRADEEGHADPREPEPLGGGHDDGQDEGGEEPPEEGASPVDAAPAHIRVPVFPEVAAGRAAPSASASVRAA